jgi:hypothetical protein
MVIFIMSIPLALCCTGTDECLESERKPILEWDPMPPDDSLNAPDDCYWVVLETIDELLLLLRKVKISLTIHEF